MLLFSPHAVRRTAWFIIAMTLFVSPCSLSTVTTCTRQVGEQRWKDEYTPRASVQETTTGGVRYIAQGVEEVNPFDGTREEVSHSGLDKAWCEGRQAFPEPQVLAQRRVQEVADRVKKIEVQPRRLRSHLVGKVNDLLFDDNQDDRGAEESAAAGGDKLSQGESKAACEISDAPQARLYLQAVTVLDMLEKVRVRDLLILVHTQAASDSLEANPSVRKAMSQEAMENVSLVRLNSSLLLIAQKMAERSAGEVGLTTLLSWTRQFRQLGGCFKHDGKGVRERKWILSE